MKQCPVCLKIIKQINPRHIKKCFPDDIHYRFKYIIHNFPNLTTDNLHKHYVEDKWSIPMICQQYKTDIKTVCYMLSYYDIKIRTISETRSLKEYKSRIEKTNLDKYGATNPLSRGTKPFIARNKTINDRYGCENVFQRLDLFITDWKSCGKHSKISSLNKKLYSILEYEKIDYVPEYSIKYRDTNGKSRWKSYDAKVGNLLIEVNGDYWHANPAVYTENQLFCFPGDNNISAKDIWQLDIYKKEIAESQGYELITIWESELKNELDVTEKIKNSIYKTS